MSRAVRPWVFAMALAVTGAPAFAASPFDGVWVDDLKTQMGEAGFDTYLVSGGVYKCTSCRPPRDYPVDGKMRAVPGDPSVIAESVTILGPRTIVTRVKDHEMARETTMTVAPDNQSATYVTLDKWPVRSMPLRTEYVAQRVAPAPPRSHLVSGSWRGLRYVAVPEEYRSVELKEVSDTFSRSNFRHGHYTAIIGGPEAAVSGDGKNSFKALVRGPDARMRTETILLNGTALVERSYRLSADGSSMVTTARNPKDGSIFRTTARRK